VIAVFPRTSRSPDVAVIFPPTKMFAVVWSPVVAFWRIIVSVVVLFSPVTWLRPWDATTAKFPKMRVFATETFPTTARTLDPVSSTWRLDPTLKSCEGDEF